MRGLFLASLLLLFGCAEDPEWQELARLDFAGSEDTRAVDRALFDYPQFMEFGSDFSGPQGKGIWSYGHESTIRIWAPADSFRVTLRFSTHPVLAEAGQALELLVDGQSAGPAHRIERGWAADSLVTTLALPKLDKGAPHTITLRAALHANDSAETGGVSKHPVAIFVKSLDIDAATGPRKWNRWVQAEEANLPSTPPRDPTVRPMTVVEDTSWLVPELEELPDILFIVLDAARADHFPIYGYGRNTTPNISALAADGLVFEQYFSGSAFTLTSTATLFTGHPWATHRLASPGDVLPEEFLTMADLLGLVGYWSLAISDNANVSRATNLSQGFNEFIQTWRKDDGASGSLTGVFDARAKEGIPENRPAFFYLHALPPHSPYNPPPEHDLWAPEGYSGDVDGSVEQLNVIHDQKKLPNETDRERWISLYDGNLHRADTIAQMLIDTYRSLGRTRPVWIVVTSDHGEAFGEHERYEHLSDIHDEMTRIPLVLWPAAAWEGRVPDPSTFLSNGDMLPLLLNALGLTQLATSFSDNMHEIRPDGTIVREFLPMRSHESSGRFGMRSRDVLGIQGGHHEQFFYLLDDDPSQLNNRRRELASRYAPWIGILRTTVQELRPTTLLEPEQADISEADLEALRALGYIE